MRYIFIGYLFMFLDLNINIQGVTVGALPDFVGYLLMLKGLGQLMEESEKFTRLRPWATGMMIYTAIWYGVTLMGMTATRSPLIWGMGVLGVAVALYITYQIIQGVKDIERHRDIDLNSEKLMKTWIPLAVFEFGAYVTELWPYVAVLFTVAACVCLIIYLLVFRTTKNLYLIAIGEAQEAK